MKNVLIMGAAGRDFHNYNSFFKGNKNYSVKCFTAEQIPGISKRSYPKKLAKTKKDIPIYLEKNLKNLIKKLKIDICVLSYSDLSNQEVMLKSARVNAAGADFWLLGPESTQLKSRKKIISVCAVRTGCGKSSTTMKVCKVLRKHKKKFVVVRHPMPYGNLEKQEVQRFATFADLGKHNCTIEEREEYEPHILQGNIIYAGVDYQKILRRAEKEAQIIVWDGGNNDFPFYKSDLHIVLADPHRVGHELLYYPGQMNFLSADVILINQENTAKRKNIKKIKKHVKEFNPNAIIIDADSEISIKKSIARKKVVIVEDGPTLTHGGMAYGAGYLASQKHKARIIRPKKWAVGTLKDVFKKYKHLGNIIPAMGYSKQEIKDLEKTLNRVPADIIIDASPVRIQRLVKVNKPIVQVNYSLHETSRTDLEKVLKKFKLI